MSFLAGSGWHSGQSGDTCAAACNVDLSEALCDVLRGGSRVGRPDELDEADELDWPLMVYLPEWVRCGSDCLPADESLICPRRMTGFN